MKDFLISLRKKVMMKTLTAEYRNELYDLLLFSMRNNIPLNEAMINIREVYTEGGKRYHYLQDLCDDFIDALRENTGKDSLEAAFHRWLPTSEAAAMCAGQKSGDLITGLVFAKKINKAKSRINKEIVSISVLPLAIIGLVGGAMFVLMTQILPVIEKIIPPEQWDGITGMTYVASNFILDYWLYMLGGSLSLVIAVAWSVPRFTRPAKVRMALDSLMPWSLYKDLQGASFLLNLSSLLSSGVKLSDSFLTINETASPWLSQRVMGAYNCLREGAGAGKALKMSGMNFPSKKAVNFLSLLEGDGSTSIIKEYGEEHLERSIEGFQKKASKLRMLMMVCFAGVILIIMQIFQEVQFMVESMTK